MSKIKYVLILVVAIFVSCNEKKISDLNSQISELSKHNAELKDSISKMELKNIYAFHILGTTKKSNLKVNEENEINFVFGYRDYIKDYNVYLLNDENKRELILKDQKISEFKYSFKPKNKADNRIRLLAIFDFDSINVEIPADVTFNITE